MTKTTTVTVAFALLFLATATITNLGGLPRAARAAQQEATGGGGESVALEERTLLRVATPPFGRAPARVTATGGARLSLLSEKPNEITDNEAWRARVGVPLRQFALPAEMDGETPENLRLPNAVPTTYKNLPLTFALRGADAHIFGYGTAERPSRYVWLYSTRDRNFLNGLDFAAFAVAPGTNRNQDVRWAERVGDILYISHGHRGYAKDTGGRSAYLSAVRISDGKLLWRSAPLVANSDNFVIVGDSILTGYGFTAEKDYLFVLNRRTGAVQQRVPVRSGPDELHLKGNRLYVHCYDTDYVFAVRGAR